MQRRKKEKIRNIVGKMISRKLQFAVKAYNLRKDLTLELRTRNIIRYAFNSQIRIFKNKSDSRAANIILEFFKDLKQK